MTNQVKDSTEHQRLLESLWEDARREGDHLVKNARRKADQMIGEAEAQGTRIMAEALEEARTSISPELARITNRARIQAESELLNERTGTLDSCFEKARRKLLADDETRGRIRTAFPHLFEMSMGGFGETDDAVVMVSGDDLEPARKISRRPGQKFRIQVDETISGGVKVTVAEGAQIVDNTISSRLERMMEEPPIKLFGILFGNRDTGRDASI